MGLDISVYQPKALNDSSINVDDNFYILEEFPELKVFEKYSFEKENEYYDIESGLKKLDFEPNDVISDGAEYGENSIFSFLNKKHVLFDAFSWLDECWKNCKDTEKELESNNILNEFKEKYLNTLVEHGWREVYDESWSLFEAYMFCRNKITIELINPPTFKRKDIVIAVEEVGYQRKGANKKFYEDGKWDSPCITNKKKLLEDWEKYFSYQTPESKGGFGSGVEFNKEDDEMKNDFKRNIIDKFIEGETFVIYH